MNKTFYTKRVLGDCNATRTYNHLVRKRTLNHLTKRGPSFNSLSYKKIYKETNPIGSKLITA